MPATYEKHRAQLKAILLAWGCRRRMPRRPRKSVMGDLHGVDSHGMSMIPGYDGLRRSVGRSGRAAKIVKETPVSASSMAAADGHVPSHFAMNVASTRRRGWHGDRPRQHSAHFGATGFYTLMAAKRD